VADEGPRAWTAIIGADGGARDALALAFADAEERFRLLSPAAAPVLLPRGAAPEIVVIDPAPRGRFDRAWLAEVRSFAPQALLILYTNGFDAARLDAALEARARAYLLKGRCTAAEVVAAASLVVDAEIVAVDGAIARQFWDQPWRIRLEQPPPTRPLSKREVEVLALIADGYRDKEIEARLGIKATTVETHVARLLEKLGARTREHAVRLAMQRGLLD
jgi:DNA-binding NarL/FixJ family response regulator